MDKYNILFFSGGIAYFVVFGLIIYAGARILPDGRLKGTILGMVCFAFLAAPFLPVSFLGLAFMWEHREIRNLVVLFSPNLVFAVVSAFLGLGFAKKSKVLIAVPSIVVASWIGAVIYFLVLQFIFD